MAGHSHAEAALASALEGEAGWPSVGAALTGLISEGSTVINVAEKMTQN